MGFSPVAIDGLITGAAWERELPITWEIGRHRPDAIARDQTGHLAVVEAKTWLDIAAARTVEQLEDFVAPWNEHDYALVLFGYPQSADAIAQQQLKKAGALGCPQLVVMQVPDEVLRE